MKRIITTALVAIAGFTGLGMQPAWSAGTAAAPIPTVAANTYRGATGRVINVELVVLEQNVFYNRLGAHLPNAQLYALARDVVPLDHPFDSHGNDADQRVDPAAFQPGEVRLQVKDNGVGAAKATGGFGLLGIRERMHLLGGSLEIHTGPGKGFRLTASVPVSHADEPVQPED